jgi:hypothetical protein
LIPNSSQSEGKYEEEGASASIPQKGERGEEDLPLIGVGGKGHLRAASLFSLAPIYACIKTCCSQRERQAILWLLRIFADIGQKLYNWQRVNLLRKPKDFFNLI